MNFEADRRFRAFFKDLHQVFLYLTDTCNLRCSHCLYKPDLCYQLVRSEIPPSEALALITLFREMGASKLTLMGGEPTLYGSDRGGVRDGRDLATLIEGARELGYEYVRMDTNGVFNPRLLPALAGLHELTFSLDGPSPELNDPIRGKGSFQACVTNLKRAVRMGHVVNITCCAHRALLQRDETGTMKLEAMIRLAANLGVSRLNFHALVKAGVPRDTWTGETDADPADWAAACTELRARIAAGQFVIPVRLPLAVVPVDEFRRNPAYYSYCSLRLGERVLVHPNGIIRVCSLLIGTPYGVARYGRGAVTWDTGPTNEIRAHKFNAETACAVQNKRNTSDGMVRLCVAFKPDQDEFVWRSKIAWDSRNRA